jgi:hypothetical protein
MKNQTKWHGPDYYGPNQKNVGMELKGPLAFHLGVWWANPKNAKGRLSLGGMVGKRAMSQSHPQMASKFSGGAGFCRLAKNRVCCPPPRWLEGFPAKMATLFPYKSKSPFDIPSKEYTNEM